MSTSGDVESTSNSLPGSPRSKVKFLCSHGGKILPRPVDGHLKYVGGETRVVSVPRCITFTDLMKKLNCIIEGYDATLKYQLIPEELDALVSVKSDEDLRHMFEEYDRQNLIGTPRLQTFLFPTSPIVIDNPIGPMDRQSLEQRYINSVNGIMFNPPPIYNSNSNSNSNNNNNNAFKASAVNTSQTSFTISSACSSPRTPPEATSSVSTAASSAMTRARSSPNLCNLGASPQPNQQYPYYHHRQPPPPPPPHHMHHHPKPPLDPSPHKNSSPDHHMRMRSPGLTDYYSHSQHAPNPYARSSRSGGHMGYQRGSPYDEYYGNNRYDRESPPGSPLARSPLQNNYGSKWDPIGGR